ncbi:MAG: HXXEE domain-containing protein [Betaproteobacteria bacterium]|nr:HXXEE domain-containing protein [Betaproteobacteria bacterium]
MVFAAHNLEETLAFANGWVIHRFPQLAWTAERWPLFAAFAFALTLVVGLVAWTYRQRPERSAVLLRVFLWVMLTNAAWHIGVSVYAHSFAPGVATAVALILPVYACFLYRLSKCARG